MLINNSRFLFVFFFSSLKFSDKSEKQREEKSCVVVPDPNHPQSYLIFLKDPISRETRRFGQLTYERISRNNYHYRIIIGKNLYQLQSLDLKDRYLTMIDSIYLGNNPWDSSFASTLCQVSDQFCKSTKNFHVTVSHSENAFGYIALVILLCLYESNKEYLR